MGVDGPASSSGLRTIGFIYLMIESSKEEEHEGLKRSGGSKRQNAGTVQLLDIWDLVLGRLIDSGLVATHTRGTSLGGVPRGRKVLRGYPSRVIYYQAY